MTPSERAHYESETAQEGGGGLEGKVPDGPQGKSSADGADQEGEREIKEDAEEIPYEADLPPKQGVEKISLRGLEDLFRNSELGRHLLAGGCASVIIFICCFCVEVSFTLADH